MVFDISISLSMEALSHPGVLQLTLNLYVFFFIMQILPNFVSSQTFT